MQFLLSHKYKFLLGWSAKCGCSSIKRWYLKIHDISEPEDGNVHKYIGYGNTEFSSIDWKRPDIYHSYSKFLVVRDPYKRLVSGFLNKYLDQRLANDGWDTFTEFVGVLSNDRAFERVDFHHFTPQFSEDYRKFARRFEFDSVFKLEQLQNGLDSISGITGAPREVVGVYNRSLHGGNSTLEVNVSDWNIQQLNEYRRQLPQPAGFYTCELVEQVEDIYQLDFISLKQLGIRYPRPR